MRKFDEQNIVLCTKLEDLLNLYWWTFVLIFWCSCFIRFLCFFVILRASGSIDKITKGFFGLSTASLGML